ncbi:MAG: PEP-CTERM sorting domain-containing protein [Cellvibrio sp.]|uniref:PEP-CTERM sorting domain-containing protein n=1 Tax=Cellvibrio sp. TaxID=1965322 RepID=UPI0031A8A692
MSVLLFSATRKFFTYFAAIFLMSICSIKAFAVVINFDDLTYVPIDPEFPSFGDFPLGNEYESQGLVIYNAYLLPYSEDDDIISGRNYLLAGASGSSMGFAFVGQLPTFVGMYIGGNPVGTLHVNAYDPSGIFDSYQKDYGGWEYVTFESAAGISQIDMWATQQHRVSGAIIDDLTFNYSSVPEPSSIGLLMLAAMALFGRRMTLQ